MKNIGKKAIAAGIIGLVVGFILGWWVGDKLIASQASVKVQNQDESSNIEDSKNLDNTSLSDAIRSQESNSAILVVDQNVGSTVAVASVETDVSAWVAVREDKNGILGNILGASRIDAGDSSNIIVNLLRPTVAGETYQVVLYQDDGDREFNHKIDLPLTSDGILISKSFKVFAN